ncbi:hypothetical protein [uncultured Methanobrevibacter sp.]|uniref:hypothetical protein n=1 Tax=uncultured Methanobrevibacter sp. TaxID=253161 RepID=UPI0025D94695|nr:hypothetical protein [uncultured Methanobrevibacter sp.]
MNVIDIQDVKPHVEITSVGDTAMLLNLMYPEIVEDLLEVFTDFTDFDIIAELVDILKLPIVAVVEPSNTPGTLIHGYIHRRILA